MTAPSHRWGQTYLAHGGLRFYGVEAMRELSDLLRGDDNYKWSFPSGWPAPTYIDVYPRDLEAQNELLELLNEDGDMDRSET